MTKQEIKGWACMAIGISFGVWSIYRIHRDAIAAKRSQLITDFTSQGSTVVVQDLSIMTSDEIESVYEYYYNYIKKGLTVPPGSFLYNAINAIMVKYNIFV